MDLIPEPEFIAWAAERGIVPDPRVQYSAPLIFKKNPELTRFWLPRPSVSELPGFLTSALTAASESGPYILRPRRGGTWYVGRDDVSLSNRVRDNLMAKCAVPREFVGALRFTDVDSRQWLLMITTSYVFAWSVGADLTMLPRDGSCILMVSHHGKLQGDFPDSARLNAFVTFMAGKGYPLPDEVPAPTFKVPTWMRPRGASEPTVAADPRGNGASRPSVRGREPLNRRS